MALCLLTLASHSHRYLQTGVNFPVTRNEFHSMLIHPLRIDPSDLSSASLFSAHTLHFSFLHVIFVIFPFKPSLTLVYGGLFRQETFCRIAPILSRVSSLDP